MAIFNSKLLNYPGRVSGKFPGEICPKNQPNQPPQLVRFPEIISGSDWVVKNRIPQGLL